MGMETESLTRKAAPWLVRRKQSLLEPVEGADASPRHRFGRRTSKSLDPEIHSGDTQNISLDLGDSQDGEGNRRSLPTSSPQVLGLPTPQPTQTGQFLHLHLDEDPAAHYREMKFAALEQVQIQEELWEAARLRGGCVPCSKGTVTIAHPQGTAPGLQIPGKAQALGSQGEKPCPGPQSDPTPPRSRAGTRASKKSKSPPVMLQTRQRCLAIQGGGPSTSRGPSLPDTQPSTTPQAGLGAMKGNTPCSGKPLLTPQVL